MAKKPLTLRVPAMLTPDQLRRALRPRPFAPHEARAFKGVGEKAFPEPRGLRVQLPARFTGSLARGTVGTREGSQGIRKRVIETARKPTTRKR